jgi:hypothetical protein
MNLSSPGKQYKLPAHTFRKFMSSPPPRGGLPGASCYWCYKLGGGAKLRTCDTCHQHYCGRRQCKATHARFCGAYKPHFKETRA